MIEIDQNLFNQLFEQAEKNPRLRQNCDLRTSDGDKSQRMLNALLPGTEVPIHRHPESCETVVCLQGRLDEVLYETQTAIKEMRRIHLNPSEGAWGCQVPKGVWHTVEVFEPSIILEAKDGAYGKDGSEFFDAH